MNHKEDGIRLLVVDGHNLAYRSFFAIRDLSTSEGKPTNAVFGFVRALENLEREWRPTHRAVVMDGGIPLKRLQQFQDYKAQRAPMPDSLRPQIALIRDYLDASGTTLLLEENVEADDLMASLASWALAHGVQQVGLASNDKDLFQVVDERVFILPVAGKKPPMGPEEIKDKTGVFPEQIVEWLALVGDSADNIPGVPGIGPKKAARLLNEFGNLKSVYDNISHLPVALGTSLMDNRKLVERNCCLMTLEKDRELNVTWDRLECMPQDPDKLIPLFDRLEFTRMVNRLREPTMF